MCDLCDTDLDNFNINNHVDTFLKEQVNELMRTNVQMAKLDAAKTMKQQEVEENKR